VPCLWAGRLGRVKLQQLNRCSIVKYERNTNSNRRLGRCDQDLPTFEGFVQIVDGKGDVRNGSDDLGHVAMRLEPNPLDPVGTGLKTGDVNSEVRDMMLLSTRLRVWNPDVVVPPSELRCHGRRLMVQSLSARDGSLHRSYSPIGIIWPVESAELDIDGILPSISCAYEGNRFKDGILQSISGPIKAVWVKRLQDGKPPFTRRELPFGRCPGFLDQLMCRRQWEWESCRAVAHAPKPIVLDDILDSGHTLAAIREKLETARSRSIRICVLLSKKKRRTREVDADYLGFEIEDEFVVGYGLDYDERYRNLPCIGVLAKELITSSK